MQAGKGISYEPLDPGSRVKVVDVHWYRQACRDFRTSGRWVPSPSMMRGGEWGWRTLRDECRPEGFGAINGGTRRICWQARSPVGHGWHRCAEKIAGQVFHTGQSRPIDIEARSPE